MPQFSDSIDIARPPADVWLLRVDDSVDFKGLGKLAAPIASRDIRKRWETSLQHLKAAAEGERR
jgi:hypothetical protein